MSDIPYELVVREGPERGQRVPIPSNRFSIGSGESCAVRFPPNMVREVHAAVRRDEGGDFEVEDLTGASLLWVDGKVVTKASLVSGSIIRVGRVEMMLVSMEDTAASDQLDTTQRRPTPMHLASNPPNAEGGLAALKATPLGRPLDAPAGAPPISSSPSGSGRFSTGDTIDSRYRVTARIAAGGMGEVYKVEHIELGKALAMKVMLPGLNADQEFVNRFKIEAVAASRIGHPNIVDISDFGKTAEGRFFFVMEFLDGMTLSSLVHRQGQQSPGRAVALTLQVARALAAAHELHIVHRDLKPDNVMVLQRPGNPDLVKVLDFGVARVQVDNESIGQTAAGIVVGTPQYMSPEQAKAIPVDTRSDIYSLGLILHELLTGKPAFTGETPPIVMVKQVTEPPPPLPEWIPAELNDLVFAMLEKNPADRPQAMKDIVETLDRLARTLKTNDFQVPPAGGQTKERTPTPAPPRSGKRTAPTPARGPTPTRAPLATSAPLTVEPAPTIARSEPVAFDAEASQPGTPAPSSKAPLVIAGVLVLVLLVGGGVIFSSTTVEPTIEVIQAEPVEPVKPKPVEPAPPVEVALRIESVPPAAEVQENGIVLGNTPYTLKRKPGEVVELTLTLAGYEPAQRKVMVSADVSSVSMKLEPVKKKVEPKPEPRPEKKPGELKAAPDFGDPTPPPPAKTESKPKPATPKLQDNPFK
ncbi:MAG: protein kinase [Archangiaceae bacterium]|nr:protein kinase [Archangiaceae bacterium]